MELHPRYSDVNWKPSTMSSRIVKDVKGIERTRRLNRIVT